MAAGLFALLDDVAAMARIAAASVDDIGAAAGRASAKAAGVVVDDTAVTPQFLQGSAAARELPIIKKIAIGSLRNKLLFILPAALVLSEFAPWLLPILLIFGGTFLAYEGAHKIWEKLSGHGHGDEAEVQLAEQGELTPEHEAATVAGAIRTDFILSAEIMVIALKEVVDSEPDANFLTRAIILIVVAILITVVVYGFVALLVKMDDVGVHLAAKQSSLSKKVGYALVAGMPKVLAVISVVGIAAMIWVGGHILLISLDELSTSLSGTFAKVLHAPYDLVHHLEEDAHDALGAFGGVGGWLVNTLLSAIVGLVVGAVVVAVMHFLPRRGGAGHDGGHDSTHPGGRDETIDGIPDVAPDVTPGGTVEDSENR
ncbi:MAG: putative membrane protein [uncultured Nocardioides sp.]|uniref:Putative membrane protein n=1 Tax=uncultured Nocardioides sp. TaxID=198441 RepID=A0A6J4MZ72_9ACTN|nr:MAG: putative membrane protein [uncultured Nocardioides sp.]